LLEYRVGLFYLELDAIPGKIDMSMTDYVKRLGMTNWIYRFCQIAGDIHRSILYYERKRVALKQISLYKYPYKLHVGCGNIKFDNWINIDINNKISDIDFAWDATQHFPFDDATCALIYNEHFLEHLSIEQASAFLAECYRLLTPGGVLRIAMPSLEQIVAKYCSENWKDQGWLNWPDYQFIQTRAEMINIAFRWWDHKWLYDREELHRRLQIAQFRQIRDVDWGESIVSELKNREHRADSLLICEAIK
jgi:predicted SAM-dependent methyltransferase